MIDLGAPSWAIYFPTCDVVFDIQYWNLFLPKVTIDTPIIPNIPPIPYVPTLPIIPTAPLIPNVTVVPEISTWIMLLVGFVALFMLKYFTQKIKYVGIVSVLTVLFGRSNFKLLNIWRRRRLAN